MSATTNLRSTTRPNREETMKTRTNTSKLLAAALSATLILGACGSEADTASPNITTIEVDYAFSPDNAEATLAFADEIAVVRIVNAGISSEQDRLPVTDYEAVVGSTLSDNFDPGATIMIRQEGGIIDGETFLIEGQQLLQQGQVYVLAGRIADDGALYTLPGVGIDNLGTNDLASPAALAALADWAILGTPGNGTLLDRPGS